MNRLILASTSTLHAQDYLAYLLPELQSFFQGTDCIVFVPYARPNGMSEEDYTQKAREAFKTIDLNVIGLNEVADPEATIKKAQGIFVGGGNTFLLVRKLHELNLMEPLNQVLDMGIPYLGTSAGANIGGLGMHTTNDMPIVLPPSLKTLGRVGFNINAHYIEPDKNSTHMGETRETRIREFQCQNEISVVGLPEGSWLSVMGPEVWAKGAHPVVIFEPNKSVYRMGPDVLLPFNARE